MDVAQSQLDLALVGKIMKIALWSSILVIAYGIFKICVPAARRLFGWTPSISVHVPPGASHQEVEQSHGRP
jgi:hypothetical protein